MGISIHYTFVRRKPLEALLQQVAAKARRKGMRVERCSTIHLLINPHPDSESIDLHFREWKALQKIDDASEDTDECKWLRQTLEHDFGRVLRDDDWVCQSFTKTQFAGWQCHCDVAELLRFVGAYCRLVEISDEAGYYEAGTDRYEPVKAAFDSSSRVIGEFTGVLKETFGSDNVLCAQDREDKMGES